MALKPIYLAVIGTGGVGKHFLSQVASLTTKYPEIRLVAVTRSSKGISTTPQERPIPLDRWESLLAASTHQGLLPSDILSLLTYHGSPQRSIVIDNTSDENVAKSYPSFLKAGISVVTPNKKAFSSSLDLWNEIFSSSSNPPPTFPQSSSKSGNIYHESTVGAGLPIISTLTDLLATGDKIHRIEGVFSGTMSYLFNTFAPVSPSSITPKWSATVLAAKEAGYTEPDPRDDLNGADVARKLVILARLIGSAALPPIESISSFPVQSLIPDELTACTSGDEFLARLPEFDGEMEKIKNDAASKGKIVRFVGKIDVNAREVKVGLEQFDTGSPVAGLKGSDNLVAFYTERYPEQPLVIQGSGAGGAVTAMGVTADLLKIFKCLA